MLGAGHKSDSGIITHGTVSCITESVGDFYSPR